MARTEDYHLGEFGFARGWFAVANSNDVGRKPMPIHYFGQDMVLYRGETGRVVMLDAYCPHMGTHLASGASSATVNAPTHMEGDNIRCPFHGWRFGPDGLCNNIPYREGPIPRAARVKSWAVEERYDIVFAWHDPEGLEPDFELVEFPEWHDPEFVRWCGLEYLTDLKHPIEILDNLSDVRHLSLLHGTDVVSYENQYEGHVLYQRQRAGTGSDDNSLFGSTLTTYSRYVGPGTLAVHYVELQTCEIICVTPIDDGTCRMWQTAMVKRLDGMDEAVAQEYRDTVSAQFGKGLLDDAEIWATKRPATAIMQLPEDGPFRQSRTWYSQFYNPRPKAAEIAMRISGTYYAKGMPGFDAEGPIAA
ncbi:MAG: Rieske 2Fe-2S domain-containing protein [Novosphingobium sp.]